MARNETIEHDGVVQKSGNESVTILISSASACSGCHAANSCTLSQAEEKIIEIHGNYRVERGDKVKVLMKKTMGYSALFIGYIAPLFLVVIMLIVLSSMNIPELAAGAGSLGILVPYYLILFLLKNKISKRFTFTIQPV